MLVVVQYNRYIWGKNQIKLMNRISNNNIIECESK